uniref:Uncharacterized protein n=1 Tax=Kalanchoe fedtschenkoi TaxID=63787 RepID=A0A7N0U884_KALFE
METSPTKLGSKGLIRKQEFIRLIIQCLCSLGYKRTASSLESESGIFLKHADFEKLESHILQANWDDVVSMINSVFCLKDRTRNSALFSVFKQWLLECLTYGDDSLAVSILRKQVRDSELEIGKIQSLAVILLSFTDIGLAKMVESDILDKREHLILELEKLLPPPFAIPGKRLEHLVETVVTSQLESCMYHNSATTVSLYDDHCCDRDEIPTETVQILTAHSNEVWFVQFSNNGEFLASSSSDCTAIIWKVLEDGGSTLVHVLESHQKPVSFLAWSPDDTKLLTCGNGEVLKLWDVETGTCRHTFGDHDFIVSSCAWFPDSKRFVSGSSDPEKGICMWDCNGNELKAWRGMRMPKVLDLAVTPNGQSLISIFSDKEIRILNMESNSEKIISEEHAITSLSISADSKFLMVNLNSQEIHMWDVAGEWKKPLRYTGHKQFKYVIRSCFGGFNCMFVASGSEDSQVYIWNRRKSTPIEVLSGHLMTVNCVSWNPKRPKMLASASDDQTVRIWGSTKSKHIPSSD